MLLFPVLMVVQVSAPRVLAPAPRVPVVLIFVLPNEPTENVPEVIWEAGRFPTAEAEMDALGRDTEPAETVRPLDAVKRPATVAGPMMDTLLLKVLVPDTVSALDPVMAPPTVKLLDRKALLHAVAEAPRS